LVKEKSDTCYQMYPTEGKMYPQAIYFAFASAIGSSLCKGASLLQALGFLRVIEASQDFRHHILALRYTRTLVAKYNKEINYIGPKNNRVQENMITLGNIKSVLYVGFFIIMSAGVVFVPEVFSIEIVFTMLTK